MGNQQSAPEGYVDILTNANQARLVGVSDPVTQTETTKSVLAAASPTGLNLAQVTATDTSETDRAADKCNSYTEIAGLRQLQKDVGSRRTALEPGCGWYYQPPSDRQNSGIGGESRGAFGTVSKGGTSTPVFSKAGQRDEIKGGALFDMDLQNMEEKISEDLQQKYTNCKDLAPVANIDSLKNVLGFCKDTNRTIPIERPLGAPAVPRFPDHPKFRCPGEIILPENTSKCPPPGPQSTQVLTKQGFKNPTSADVAGSAYIAGRGSDGYHGAFMAPTWAIQNTVPGVGGGRGFAMEGFSSRNSGASREGFSSRNSASSTPSLGSARGEGFIDFETCASRGLLSANATDCLEAAARAAGFTEKGSYIPYITSGTVPAALANFEILANIKINKDALLDGRKNINELIRILGLVSPNLYIGNDKLKTAALDLRSDAGKYEETYNVCEWFFDENDQKLNETPLNPQMKDAAVYQQCMENYWRNKGGDSRGVAFPTLANYTGRTVRQFKNDVAWNDKTSAGNDPNEQSGGLARKYGVATYQEQTSGTVEAPPQACAYKETDIPGQTCPPFFDINTARPKVNKKIVVTQAALAGGDCKYTDGAIITVPCDSSQPLQPQNCEWTPQKTQCSKTCGNGTVVKSWIKTKTENALGTCPPKPADETHVCEGNNCGAGDCKYTVQETQKCPDGSDMSKCGKQFQKVTTYDLDSQNPTQAAKFCPTPNPKVENCPVIQCPASDTSAVGDCEAVFYDDVEYRGKAVRLPVGEYGFDAMTKERGIPNDSIRSMRLGRGVNVIGYYHAGFVQPYTFTSNMPTLGNYDRNISGLKIVYKPGGPCAPPPPPPAPAIPPCEVWLYYEANYGTRPGFPTYTVLQAGDYDYNNLISRAEAALRQSGMAAWFGLSPFSGTNNKAIDDLVKSIRVGSGVRVKMYSDPGFRNNERVIEQNVADMGWMYGAGPGISALKIEPKSNQCLSITSLSGKCSARTPIGVFRLGDLNTRPDYNWNRKGTPWEGKRAQGGWFFMARKDLNTWADGTNHGNQAYKYVVISDRDLQGVNILARITNIEKQNGIKEVWEMGPQYNGSRWVVPTGRAFCWFFELAELNRNGQYVASSKPASRLFLQRGGKSFNGQDSGYCLVGHWPSKYPEWGPNSAYFNQNKSMDPLRDFYGGSEGTPQWGEAYILSYAIWND